VDSSEAKKVSAKGGFPLIAASKQPSVPDRSSERRGQDPKRQALSGIGNLNGRLLVLNDDQGLATLSESSDDCGLRNQGRIAVTDSYKPVKFLYRKISACLTIGSKPTA
jgi:hypothetical protein